MNHLQLRKIPLADDAPRVESGPLLFGDDDWPGVFLRGDEALPMAMYLRNLLETAGGDAIQVAVLRGFVDTLESCHINDHREPEPVAT